ncbi:MAG: bifunctional phosphoglucose/phosphomannose isomerase [Patescibacteria group bacterium]|nr:bifunctional phosphoglucose/phosphomannose isomerase [Patescibacteria group bacterium]
MREKILDLINQFDWIPEIFNKKDNQSYDRVIVCGMGGSHLAADILQSLNLNLEIFIWTDYGLPDLNLKKSLIIIDSYSGDTEEAISSFSEAKKRNLNLGIITSGGKLLDLAKKYKISYIQIPKSNIQPRMALIYQILALLKFLNQENEIKKLKKIKNKINLLILEKEAKKLVPKIYGLIPIIYSSNQNKALAYILKIKFNESSKIPAFYNIFPELNHNEMQGFDTSFNINKNIKKLINNFLFIFLNDFSDNKLIKKRIKTTSALYKQKGLNVLNFSLNSKNKNNFWFKIVNFLFLTDWLCYYLSLKYDNKFEEVPLIEIFKRKIK